MILRVSNKTILKLAPLEVTGWLQLQMRCPLSEKVFLTQYSKYSDWAGSGHIAAHTSMTVPEEENMLIAARK